MAKPPFEKPANAVDLIGDDGTHEFVAMSGGELDWQFEDGVLTSTRKNRRSNHAISKDSYRDFICHYEFLLAEKGASNSGVYFQGLYEIQILRAKPGKKIDFKGLGAIYGVRAPDANPALETNDWYKTDARFIAPRRNEQGEIETPGRMTVWMNGKLLHDNIELGEPNSQFNPYRYRSTPYLQEIWKAYPKTEAGPFAFQDHDAPVKFRNIWVAPIEE